MTSNEKRLFAVLKNLNSILSDFVPSRVQRSLQWAEIQRNLEELQLAEDWDNNTQGRPILKSIIEQKNPESL